MMDATGTLALRVNADHFAVEAMAWAWVTGLPSAAETCGSAEVVRLADAVEQGLIADRADGLLDLALAGSSVGGLGRKEVAALVRMVDARLESRSPLAA
jgi:hypothetical protein